MKSIYTVDICTMNFSIDIHCCAGRLSVLVSPRAEDLTLTGATGEAIDIWDWK